MPKFVLMTRLAPEAIRDVNVRKALGKEWLNKVKAACPDVKWIAHYALLGPYDFMDVYEAPDEETAAKVSMISLAHGALTEESWVAIPYRRILELAREI